MLYNSGEHGNLFSGKWAIFFLHPPTMAAFLPAAFSALHRRLAAIQ
jgi:hypothetical protein